MPVALSDQPVVIERVLVGEDDDPARRGSKRLVARSECRFDCQDDASLDRCIEALRRSDENLRRRPRQPIMYDWQSMFVRPYPDGGGLLTFGVAWYDEAFFDAKHDVYLNPQHEGMFEHIGMGAGSVSISHWKLVGEGAR
jgi:hypothetical protein